MPIRAWKVCVSSNRVEYEWIGKELHEDTLNIVNVWQSYDWDSKYR